MFLLLFSDHAYEMEKWPHVFQVENWIHACIREYWREMAGLSDDELIIMLRNRVKRLVFRAGEFSLPDDSFITEVLEQEVGRIARLVADLQKKDATEERETLGAHFRLNAVRLQECLSRSREFHEFIVNRPKFREK